MRSEIYLAGLLIKQDNMTGKFLHFKKKTSFIILIPLFFLFNSCSVEYKIAKEFTETENNISLLVFAPDYIFKNNLKIYEFPVYDSLTDDELDSALFFNSIFLKNLDDSIFFENYMNNLYLGLSRYGIKVFPEYMIDSFLLIQTDAYILNIAQIELEEYIMPYTAEEYFGEYLYSETIGLNAVNINSWFEITKVNEDENEKKVLYASHLVFDDLSGSFSQNIFTSEISFSYLIDPMTENDIYKLSALLGTKYAGYTFDYFLNNYIIKHLPENYHSDKNLHYNPFRKTLTPANDDGFIEM